MERAAEISPPGKVKRRWWLLGVVLAMAAAFATLKAVPPSEFSFLNDLSPTAVVTGLQPWIGRPPGSPEFTFELFYYNAQAKDKVLAAMRGRLTKAEGYRVTTISLGGGGTFEEYEQGTYPDMQWASFATSELGTDFLVGKKPSIEPGGCVVTVAREANVWERKWRAVRKFLHLE